MAAAMGLASMATNSGGYLPGGTGLPEWISVRRRRDECLVERIRGGEKELFYELLRPHVRTLHGIIYKILGDTAKTEDAVQQSILQAFVHFHQLRSAEFFRAWLIRIAINEARIALRHDRNMFLTPIEGEAEGEEGEIVHVHVMRDPRATPAESLEHKEMQAILRAAIRNLPPKLRNVLILRDIEECSIVETARTLGISIPATKARLHRARLRLKASRSIMELHRSRAA